MDIERFKLESDEWMKSLGYELQMKSGDGRFLTYSHTNLEGCYPGFSIYYNEGDPRVSITEDRPLKMLIRLFVEGLQFKHPNIQDWIDHFRTTRKVMELSMESGRYDRILSELRK